MSRALHRMNATQALVGACALTLLLYFIPGGQWVLWPLTLLYTLVHELGHGLTAALFGGSFGALYLWPDASGLASYQGAFGRVGRAAVAAGGLLAPPIAAAGLFAAARRPGPAHAALGVFAIALVVVALLWVRNAFALIYVGALAAGLLVLALKAPPRAAQFVAVFLAIELTLSVFSRADYLFKAEAQTAQGVYPSDTGQIADALFLPFWLWGAVIAALSVGVLVLGLRLFARALR